MIYKNCEKCGKVFTTYPSIIRRNRGKYCSKQCSSVTLFRKGVTASVSTQFKKGQKAHNFNGYTYQKSRRDGKKYKLLYMPYHPNATKKGYIREHRYVMEQKLGRYLLKKEIVHHIDGDTLNNSKNDLEVMRKIEHDRMNTPLNIHRRWYAT